MKKTDGKEKKKELVKLNGREIGRKSQPNLKLCLPRLETTKNKREKERNSTEK